ncbi:MAG: zinc transporter ZntB [Sphingomonadales bacterium]|jgi:zinc transporter
MTRADPYLFAYAFDGKGGGRSLEGSEVAKTVRSKALAWAHLDATHKGARRWLREEIDYLDPLVVEGLLADETRPRFEQFGDGVLLILRGVNLNENAQAEDMVSIRIWADAQRIISVQRRQLRAVQDIRTMLVDGNGPKSMAEFLCVLVAKLFDRMNPLLTELNEGTDAIEERILEEPEMSQRTAIVEMRRKAIILRRYMAPQRDAIDQLRMADLEWLNELNRRYLQESYNIITRYIEDLESIRERAQIVKDELATTMADRLNKNLYVLSVIAAVFLPISFLTSLFGINIGGMPGIDSGLAFWIFSGSLVVVVALEIIIFKYLKWF